MNIQKAISTGWFLTPWGQPVPHPEALRQNAQALASEPQNLGRNLKRQLLQALQDISQAAGQPQNQVPRINIRQITFEFQPSAVVQQAGQSVQTAMGQIAVLITQSPAMLAQVSASILGFFFGTKKHRIEEREKRDKDDFAKTDLFTRRKIDPSGAGGGQGGHRQ